MGKRKRKEEDAEESSEKSKRPRMEEASSQDELNRSLASPSSSPLSSIYLPDELYNELLDDDLSFERENDSPTISQKKKSVTFEQPSSKINGLATGSSKKKKNIFKEEFDSSEDKSSGRANGSLKKKRHRFDEKVDSSEDEVASGKRFYIIKKPKEVSIEELSNLKLPRNLSSDKKVKLKTENGTYILKPVETPRPFHYFPSKVFVTKKDRKIKSTEFITNQAVLVPIAKKIPGGSISNGGGQLLVTEDMAYPPSSIRKKIKVELETKQERLKAFGVEKKRISKKSKKTRREID